LQYHCKLNYMELSITEKQKKKTQNKVQEYNLDLIHTSP
jgi:hypothetical protein